MVHLGPTTNLISLLINIIILKSKDQSQAISSKNKILYLVYNGFSIKKKTSFTRNQLSYKNFV